MIPHALERVDDWRNAWSRSGRLVLLLDFDGTLAPIVPRPEDAAMLPSTRVAVERLLGMPGVEMAVVSGRGMGDARERAALPGIAYAGNHGMEIEGPAVRRIHEEAAEARPALAEVAERLRKDLAAIAGAFVEDKGLTLSIHYRLVDRHRVDDVRLHVMGAVAGNPQLRTMEGKEILEIRPAVDWHKGRAVEFLLGEIDPPAGTPVIYIGDDVTDEDAFRALRDWSGGSGEGVVVGDPPADDTSASCYVRNPLEVGEILAALARPPAD
ncbi:MAG TPA: trehalose-phosphatase [Longimicrobiaceae bacterium]|nr:trehalose-phosphatase [Longimicrobium sp.]